MYLIYRSLGRTLDWLLLCRALGCVISLAHKGSKNQNLPDCSVSHCKKQIQSKNMKDKYSRVVFYKVKLLQMCSVKQVCLYSSCLVWCGALTLSIYYHQCLPPIEWARSRLPGISTWLLDGANESTHGPVLPVWVLWLVLCAWDDNWNELHVWEDLLCPFQSMSCIVVKSW